MQCKTHCKQNIQMSSGQKPTNNNSTPLEAFKIMAMNMTHLLLLGTSSLKTLFLFSFAGRFCNLSLGKLNSNDFSDERTKFKTC